MTDDPPNTGLWAELSDRAVIAVSGPDWRGFLQGHASYFVVRRTLRGARNAALAARRVFD